MKLPAAASIASSAGIIILLFGTTGHWVAVILVAAPVLVWLVGLDREWRWSYDAGFLALVAAAAWGVIWQTTPVWLLLVAVMLALIGWDLSRLLRRLATSTKGEQLHRIQNGHVRHLALVLAAILVVVMAGYSVQIQLSLGQTILLGLALVLSLTWLFRTVRRERSS